MASIRKELEQKRKPTPRTDPLGKYNRTNEIYGEPMLCVIAKLDPRSTQTLRSLQEKIRPDSAGISPLYGHITLATYMGDNEAQLIRFCKTEFAELASFPVQYTKLAVWASTSILVALPEKSSALEAVHHRITEAFHDSLNPWTQEGLWQPHTTLLFEPALDLTQICRRGSMYFTPFSAEITRIEFSRILASGYEIVDHVDLTAAPTVSFQRPY